MLLKLFFAGVPPYFFVVFLGVMYSFVRHLCVCGVLYENDFCEPLVVAENQKYDQCFGVICGYCLVYTDG